MTVLHGRVASGCRRCLLAVAIIFSLPLSAFALQQSSPPATAPQLQAPPQSQAQSAQPGQPGQTLPQQPNSQLSGSISGTVADQTGTAVAGAKVTLAHDDHSPAQEALTDDDGRFSIANAAAGPYQLTIAAEGFATKAISGTLHAGENFVVPQIAMALATENTEVQVGLSRADVAEVEIKEQEKQRVLGFIPNFYVSYLPDPVPLTSKQKFELAWRTAVDPVTFVLTGAAAGLQQAQNDFGGYGQGAKGYGERYGASYADLLTGTFIGSAILPSLLKQDPRYFYKGSGSTRSRILYALANAVICKGDNKRWQANYSGIIGSLAAGGISNLYYPAKDRGAGLTFENAIVGIGEAAAANLLQEFVIRKLTPKVPNRGPANP
jgi:hypothetical protein